ncbi:MAG: hypothetical protein AAF514_24155 [Verrucomicrobiota bacterium]
MRKGVVVPQFFCLFLFLTTAVQARFADHFSDAGVLGVGETWEITLKAGAATLELGDPAGNGHETFWGRWRAPVDGSWRLQIESPVRVDGLVVSIYRGQRLEGLTLVRSGTARSGLKPALDLVFDGRSGTDYFSFAWSPMSGG